MLADVTDSYASLVSYVTQSIINSEEKGNYHGNSMEKSKDVLNTERDITEDHLRTNIAEHYWNYWELYRKKTTYLGIKIPNRKCLPVPLKRAKGRQVLSLESMWKNKSPVMIMPYFLKANKNIFLVSIEHSEPNLCEKHNRKLVFIVFYNSQQCRVNIVNQIL